MISPCYSWTVEEKYLNLTNILKEKEEEEANGHPCIWIKDCYFVSNPQKHLLFLSSYFWKVVWNISIMASSL
jgi:hypothetical protein